MPRRSPIIEPLLLSFHGRLFLGGSAAVGRPEYRASDTKPEDDEGGHTKPVAARVSVSE
ncbi:hypothetical protein [Haladaptatus sp. NG-WS-4]